MAKPSEPGPFLNGTGTDNSKDWNSRKDAIIGLGERSFHKSYYPQLRANLERLERFRTLLDRTTDFVILVAMPGGTIADSNAAFGQLVGKPTEELTGCSFESLGLGEAAIVLDELRREMDSRGNCPALDNQDSCTEMPGHSLIAEYHREGLNAWLELTYRITMLDGHCYGVMVGRDVTEREHSRETVEALLAEKEALLDNALVGIAMLRGRMIISCNRRYEEIYGYPRGALIGCSTQKFSENDEAFAKLEKEANRRLNNGESFSATLKMRRADGSLFWGELAGRAIAPSPTIEASIWTVSDVTERKQAEERAQYLSYHDALTGLPNQLLLQDRLQQAIGFSTRDKTKLALLVVDIDRFKAINDIFGHAEGDGLLIKVAERLEKSMRSTDTISRQGGDEFHLLLTNLSEPDAVITFVGKLMESMLEPFEIKGKELTISFSAGIAVCPEDGSDFGTLLRKSDMAMYRAKDAGRNTYRFFNEEMNDDAVEQVTIYSGLRRGLVSGHFFLHYQPLIAIASGELIGAEALIRWQHPNLGLVSPARFIPVAEETGLIVEIGDWVLREACREAARWHEAGRNVPVAVNLSALQFQRGNIEQSVARALEESGLDPSMLELELTETILIHDTDNVMASVKRLKVMGVKLSIDDFGTGYSSLSYLKRFDVDKLKIDQSFIRELISNPEDAAIVRAIIQMARSLGLRTIAEGVETRQVLDILRIYHCDEAQGYYFSLPMPAEDFRGYLASRL